MDTKTATALSLPRANAATLPKHVESNVLVIGKVDQIQGTEVTIQLSDGKVVVHVGDGLPPLEIGAVYEFMGKVVDDSSLKAVNVINIRQPVLPSADFERRLIALRNGAAGRGLFNKAA